MISITGLTKAFSGNIVINDLNFDIQEQEIVALVGRNGAGKSTLIRLLSGLIKPDSGQILMNHDAKVGVLLGGDVNFYKNLTAYETICYFGKLHGLDQGFIDRRLNELDEILNIKEFSNKRAYTFSRGMRQKVGLALAVIHDPDVLLLDEPSTGLDLETSNNVIDFIKYLKAQGKTIVIATHNIFEISDLSDNIAFLSCGKIQQKVKTGLFFKNCLPDEKNQHLVQMIRKEGGL